MHSSSALNFVVVMQVDRPGFEGRSSSHPADVSIALKLEALGSCRVVGVILVILLVAELCETYFCTDGTRVHVGSFAMLGW
jgi:hypothetical protein